MLQILHRSTDGDGIDRAGFDRQGLVFIEVLNEPAAIMWISLELLLVHAVADDIGISRVWREMRDPASHQIENLSARRKDLGIERGYRRDRVIVDMGDETRCRVEEIILTGIILLESLRR